VTPRRDKRKSCRRRFGTWPDGRAAEGPHRARSGVAPRRPRKGGIVGIATRLSDIELSDWKGEARALAAYWRERTIVLVFIRHFG
jgi:hypothetical protein